MELSNYLPLIMLLVFSAMSWRVWKSESNDQKVLMICMGWAGIAVLSFVGSIILFVVAGGIIVPAILFTLSPVAAYVANQFKNVQRT